MVVVQLGAQGEVQRAAWERFLGTVGVGPHHLGVAATLGTRVQTGSDPWCTGCRRCSLPQPGPSQWSGGRCWHTRTSVALCQSLWGC